jgi:hypothetical protein
MHTQVQGHQHPQQPCWPLTRLRTQLETWGIMVPGERWIPMSSYCTRTLSTPVVHLPGLKRIVIGFFFFFNKKKQQANHTVQCPTTSCDAALLPTVWLDPLALSLFPLVEKRECAWDRVWLCSPSWLPTLNPPASVLGLQTCTTNPISFHR